MSYSTNARTNKHQKHLKAHFQQYLYNFGEPEDNGKRHVLPGDEDTAELEKQADRQYFDIKRHIRLSGRRLQLRYS